MTLLVWMLTALISSQVSAQDSVLAMRRLGTNLRVLHIAAHPDDEDAATLTWFARHKGAHVVLLSLNRGEAGANLVSNDFFERLGALRTLEFLGAVRIYGASGLRFTRVVDYGYSKNVAETFRNWKQEDVLRDVVRIVREEQPHIVLSRFSGTPRDGHGNHEAAGILALQAFHAAADPSRFPDLNLPPWKAAQFFYSQRRQPEPPFVVIDTSSVAEQARTGYAQHKSQFAGAPFFQQGPPRAYWRPLDPSHSAFLDVPSPLTAQPGPSSLARLLQTVRTTLSGKDREIKIAQVEQALAASLHAALQVESTSGPVATPGERFTVTVNFSRDGVVALQAPPQWKVVKRNGNTFDVTVASNAVPTAVCWSRASVHRSTYDISDEKCFSKPLPDAPLRAVATYRIDGIEASLQRDVDLTVAPAVSLRFSSSAGYLPLGSRAYLLKAVLRNHAKTAAKGTLALRLPPGWTSQPRALPYNLTAQDDEIAVEFQLIPPPVLLAGKYEIEAVPPLTSFHRVSQLNLGALHLNTPARHTIQAVDVKLPPGLRTAYIPGTGDDVPEAMRQLGIAPEIVTPDADLSPYHTVILGIRAYAAREDVKVHNARLLEYVRNGGVLIVQYNTQEYDRNFGPHPYSQTPRAEEVSEEDSPVTILEPQHPVFHTPNKITPQDFQNWVEQRGSKFFTAWDPLWTPLIETHDTGQQPQKGIWLVARHGKGLYVYCALAWYRQLPFAVPGAARLFANLVSLRP
ncbi:MAG: PIG-L family deacetylase [Bryobacterales bacterium]|nr:PIG-L family deacetylase [Bryobacterales bacterium]